MKKNLSPIFSLILLLIMALTTGGCVALCEWAFDQGLTPLGSLNQFIKVNGENQEVGKKTKVVVFVHGIGGDNLGTWKNKDGTYWPEKIATDSFLKNDFDVFVASFYVNPDEKPQKSKKVNEHKEFEEGQDVRSIWGFANNLTKVLRKHSIFPKSEHETKLYPGGIYFIAHSMGNLVVRTALVQQASLLAKTKTRIPLIVSLASPSKGSKISDIALKKTKDKYPELADMQRFETQNSFLELLNHLFENEPIDTEIACAYEGETMGEEWIVTKHSALAVCSREEEGNENGKKFKVNHVNIAKPSQQDKEGINKWVTGHLTKESGLPVWVQERWAKNEIIIAGKDYVESNIHLAMMALMLEQALSSEIKVCRQYEAGDGKHLFHHLERGEIDIYAEYSGSVLYAYLGMASEKSYINDDDQTGTTESQDGPEFLVNKALKENSKNMVFYPSFGFNSPFHLVMLKSKARQLGISVGPKTDQSGKNFFTVQLSDILNSAENFEIVGGLGFFYRNDGFRAIQEASNEGIDEKHTFGDRRYLEHEDIYEILKRNEQNKKAIIAVAYKTDPALFNGLSDGPVILRPDELAHVIHKREIFPPHFPGPLVNPLLEIWLQKRGLGEPFKNALEKLGGIFKNPSKKYPALNSEEDMAKLNEQGKNIWRDFKSPEARARKMEEKVREFLIDKGIFNTDSPVPSIPNCSSTTKYNINL